ncbi:MAG: twin-arginine translocase subunit TatC [bacterium]|nr:twin-arginine translocase subunit TatC [bacterium]
MTTKLRPPRSAPPPKAVPPAPPSPDEEEGGARMTFLDHLNELRIRITRAALALVIGTVIGFALADPVLNYLLAPYGDRLQVLEPTGTVVSYFRVALLIGGVLSIPLTTYQLLMFIFPALTRKEKRYLLLALPAITLLFVAGAIFAWLALVPPALDFLENFQSDIFFVQWEADSYLGFVTALVFWMGVASETPLIFFVLSLLGLVGPMVLLKNWRVAVVGSGVAAAMITPTIDPVNMFLVMGPLLTLYAFSIILTAIGRRISRVEPTAP